MEDEQICQVCQDPITEDNDTAQCKYCGLEFHYPECGNSFNFGEVCANCAKHD